MAERFGEPGGILALLDLIERHRGALEYDFRTRFHVPLSAVPEDMDWGEAWRLVTILRSDPSSQLTAALEGWRHPISREALILSDLFDLQHFSKAKKQPPLYPRPWPTSEQTTRRKGDAAGRTRQEVIEILRTKFGQPS